MIHSLRTYHKPIIKRDILEFSRVFANGSGRPGFNPW